MPIPETHGLQQQQGVALLTILIMVVLATILAMSILRYQQANLDETRLLLRQDQALQYAQSAEFFFSELLVQDAKDNEVDSLNENWAQPFPIFPVDDGFVSGQLLDNQGKFNLNTLLKETGEKNEIAEKFFREMLKRLNIDENLADAVIDWQDADDETISAMGAENSYYQGVAQDYLAPNQMFASVQQLQWVRGFEGENYQKLKPYVTVLPTRQSKMNINTVEPFLVTCLSPQLDVMVITNTLQRTRNDMKVLNNFSELWEIDGLAGIDAGQRNVYADLFDIKSDFFVADIQVELSQRQRTLRTWLYRSGQNVQSYQHSWVIAR